MTFFVIITLSNTLAPSSALLQYNYPGQNNTFLYLTCSSPSAKPLSTMFTTFLWWAEHPRTWLGLRRAGPRGWGDIWPTDPPCSGPRVKTWQHEAHAPSSSHLLLVDGNGLGDGHDAVVVIVVDVGADHRGSKLSVCFVVQQGQVPSTWAFGEPTCVDTSSSDAHQLLCSPKSAGRDADGRVSSEQRWEQFP